MLYFFPKMTGVFSHTMYYLTLSSREIFIQKGKITLKKKEYFWDCMIKEKLISLNHSP
jgi:hypothetical protein